MEAASAIGYTEKLIGAPRAREVVVHEIAHQWFGNAVTERDWNDVWLSEGFATYFTLLFTELDAGRDAFVAGLEKNRPGPRLRCPAPGLPGGPREPDRHEAGHQHPDLSEGSLDPPHAPGPLGTEAFWRGIRAYYADTGTGTPRPRTSGG